MNAKHIRSTLKTLFTRLIIPAAAAMSISAHAAQPLKVGYSDWPGYVAWQIAIDKGWLKQAGLDVDFEWFDYSASLDAFSAGKLDGVLLVNSDALVTGAAGGKSVMIMLTDYSSGNDMIVAKPGIKSIAQLKGKKVAVEEGLVEHLLLLYGLKKAGMTPADVTIVNAKTNEMPQVLASGDVAAIGAWQPVSGQAMKAVPGSRPVLTSAAAPGLIYDALAVTPASAKTHRAEWLKMVKIWDRVVHYINDPKTQPDALRIMSARDGLTPEAYLPLLKGTHLLDLAANRKAYVKGPGLDSIYGSNSNADAFNVTYKVYKDHQNVDSYLDPSFVNAK